MDVILAALRIYEWILARQTKDESIVIVAEGQDSRMHQLVNFVKDKELARQYFADRDIFIYDPHQSKPEEL